MRVVQLIDSLSAGGAERIAVTLANSLSTRIEGSYLCVSRKEGILKSKLHPNVSYLFLDKRGTLDFSALLRFRRFVKQNKIDIIHAHTTSYFFATLLKILTPTVKLIWHEHHGNRVTTKRIHNKSLYLCSYFFGAIIAVNEALSKWCKKELTTKKVVFVPNFVESFDNSDEIANHDKLIVCLANLRVPKNHLNLLKAFKIVHEKFPDWKLQLVGNDFNDAYSEGVKNYISENNLETAVEVMGGISDTEVVLRKASIGVLSSDSEGLPMALLEYGASGLVVVTTKVGECEKVISTFGKTVPSNNSNALSEALLHYIEDKNARLRDAQRFREHIYPLIPEMLFYHS